MVLFWSWPVVHAHFQVMVAAAWQTSRPDMHISCMQQVVWHKILFWLAESTSINLESTNHPLVQLPFYWFEFWLEKYGLKRWIWWSWKLHPTSDTNRVSSALTSFSSLFLSSFLFLHFNPHVLCSSLVINELTTAPLTSINTPQGWLGICVNGRVHVEIFFRLSAMRYGVDCIWCHVCIGSLYLSIIVIIQGVIDCWSSKLQKVMPGKKAFGTCQVATLKVTLPTE